MSSERGCSGGDLWSEIGDHEEGRPQIHVIYTRRRAEKIDTDEETIQPMRENRLSIPANKRISWNRSLSTRGRQSIVISRGERYIPLPKQREAKRKPKQARVNKKYDFEKEREYFREVDSLELVEESPSPKNFGYWTMGTQSSHVIHDLPSILERWMISKKLTYSCGPSGSLSKILETPAMESISSDISGSSNEMTPENISTGKIPMECPSVQDSVHSTSMGNHHVQESSICKTFDALHITDAGSVRNTRESAEVLSNSDAGQEDLGEAVKKLSLGDHRDSLSTLLVVCGQSGPSRLSEVFSQYCDLSSIVKIGEGTYGEAFKVGATVCKIVPIDGDLRVNGEIQKRSTELLEEVLLSQCLNSLRGHEGQVYSKNTCTNFINTKDLRVCEGAYDASLVRAWEDWDTKHGSENDHPKEFPESQRYVVFILADGGRDLESFVLLNFDEARSLLVQVTAALAVAEVAFEFEHRDLHWGNILLARTEAKTVEFTLQGRHMQAKTFGLSISIIDFTLSRINTGEAILFFDLSADPGLFDGPKGDRQSETYRKMKEITDECWEGCFPKTNVLWLQYLVDILLLKKTFQRTANDERELRSLKKRLNWYDSAKDALSDSFFIDLWVDQACEETRNDEERIGKKRIGFHK